LSWPQPSTACARRGCASWLEPVSACLSNN
jgi:hypothetical protein